MWLCQNESASFWMSVLMNLKTRGVDSILVTSTDNLKGVTDAIKSVYPEAKTQICIVHELRNSLKFVVWKDKKRWLLPYGKYTMLRMQRPDLLIFNILSSSGERNILTSPSPGKPTGIIWLPFLSSRSRSERLFTPPISSRT